MCDFEIGIHIASMVIFDEVETMGCLFHFSQCIWKRVQEKGMVTAYNKSKKFKKFIRCVTALPFVKLSKLQATVDWLRNWNFNTTEEEDFKDFMVDYIQDYWLDGVFPPPIWNCRNRQGGYTNNPHEGFNSNINKSVRIVHPNPWILGNKHKTHLFQGETKAKTRQLGGMSPKPKLKYLRQDEKRKRLIKNNDKGLIGDEDFLVAMGSSIMKTDKLRSKQNNSEELSNKIPVGRSLADDQDESIDTDDEVLYQTPTDMTKEDGVGDENTLSLIHI